MTILICYDGSSDAQAAIDRVGQLMPGGDATVLVIWETLLETMTRHGALGTGFGMVGAYDDDKTDTALRNAALDTARDGVQRAVTAGLLAQPRVVNRQDDIAADILAVAGDVGADVIAMGTRGLGSVKSLIMGSVSHAVVHHADRPVLVVPSPALADRRHRSAEHAHRQHEQETHGLHAN